MVDAQIRQRDTMSFVDLDCVRTILSLNWRYVLGAGHLRRPPLLSVFDITLKIACTFSCTCTHTSCYAAVRSHALAHIRHATLLYVLMHLHTYVMLRCCTFSCTCTHTSCYAAVRSHALAHIRHATLLYVLMHLHKSELSTKEPVQRLEPS